MKKLISLFNLMAVCCLLLASKQTIAQSSFSAGNLVILRVGDGTETLASSGNSVFVDEYSTSGSSVQSIAITNSGANALTISGTATSEGFATRATTGKFFAIPGYNGKSGSGSEASNSSSTLARVVGAVDATGTYTLTKSSNSFYSSNNIRGVISDGTNYWLAGAITGTDLFTASSAVAGIQTTNTNTECIKIYNGQLYLSTQNGTAGLYSVGSGTPTTTGTTTANLFTPSGTPQTYDFVFNSAGNVCYVADGRSSTNGGIQKWTLSGSTWSLAYTFSSFDGSTKPGAYSVAVDFTGTNPVLYVITGESSANHIAKIVDKGSVASSTISIIATAASKTWFRSLDFAPFKVSSITATASSVCSGSSTNITITGNPNTKVTYKIGSATQTPVTLNSSGTYTFSTGVLTSATTYSLVSATDGFITQDISSLSSATVSVNALPNAGTITGSSSLCAGGSSISLSDATGDAGGSWSSSNSSIALVDGSGNITSGIAGSAVITYSVTTTSCGSASATKNITVNALPDAGVITAPTTACAVTTGTLTETVSGGVWTSNSVRATIDSNTGNVAYNAAGDVTISYTTTSAGCSNTATAGITIHPTPYPVGYLYGASSICLGSAAITLTSVGNSSGFAGVFSSTNPSVATVDASGNVTAVSVGVDTILYTATNTYGCSHSATPKPITVAAPPALSPITGPSGLCKGATITLSDTASGGSWFSNISSRATITADGSVTGVNAGQVIITYRKTAGSCTNSVRDTINVYAPPAVGTISGASSICVGTATTLSDTSSGVWSMSNENATIDPSGVVMPVSAGVDTAILTVTNAAGCSGMAKKKLTLNAYPVLSAISGSANVCKGATIHLSDTATGGTWQNNMPGRATVSSDGIVTGVNPGTVIVSYVKTNFGCTTRMRDTITVNALPVPGVVTGASALCVGTSGVVHDTSAGIWTMSNGLATIDASGVVTAGASAGIDTAMITVTNVVGCSATAICKITINNTFPDVSAISGPSSVCQNAFIALADTTSGGTWSTENASIAIVTAAGSVKGISGGTVSIDYSKTLSGCKTVQSYPITVHVAPVIPVPSGPSDVCTGHHISLTDSIPGGSWASLTPSVATVASTGVVTGVLGGAAVIRYAKTISGCAGFVTDTIIVADCGSKDGETTGINNETTSQPLVSVYPNPSNGSFSVKLTAIAGKATVSLTDLQGRVIAVKHLDATGAEDIVSFDMNRLPGGVYIVEVMAADAAYRNKLVIQ